MAMLVPAGPGGDSGVRPIALPAHCLVGRSHGCLLRLDDARVSSEHARIAWREERWELRDLGSRNGTFVNDQRLVRGGMVVLAAGDELAFGAPDRRYRLTDASAPEAVARRLDTGALVRAAGGMVALPDEAQPLACVLEDADGAWALELDGEARPACDGDVVTVAGASYMLHLPAALAATEDARAAVGDSEDSAVVLELVVSPDEEHVEATVLVGGEARPIEPRAHHYTLLTLARARQHDRASQALREASQGWRGIDELCTMLDADENRLNVEIYRIRREMAAIGVHDAGRIIERRRGQVRLGTDRVTITRRPG